MIVMYGHLPKNLLIIVGPYSIIFHLVATIILKLKMFWKQINGQWNIYHFLKKY